MEVTLEDGGVWSRPHSSMGVSWILVVSEVYGYWRFWVYVLVYLFGRSLLLWLLLVCERLCVSVQSNVKSWKRLWYIKFIHRQLIWQYIFTVDFPVQVRIQIVEKFADVELRLCTGASEKLQQSSVIATFIQARETITKIAEDN